MSAFTITKEEFKNVHNGVCEIRHAIEQLDGIINDDFMTKLNAGINKLELGLQSVHEQDQNDFDSKFAHYDTVREDLGLAAVWSLYKVDNLNDRHPFEGVTQVAYKDHWGNKTVSCSVNGLTWSALYVAANACIRDSGDDHHTFIEHFAPSESDASVLLLTTGS
jgi:hypothetical protein